MTLLVVQKAAFWWIVLLHSIRCAGFFNFNFLASRGSHMSTSDVDGRVKPAYTLQGVRSGHDSAVKLVHDFSSCTAQLLTILS